MALDTINPTVTVSLTDRALVAKAQDNVGVQAVEFYKNDILIATANSEPYTYTLSDAEYKQEGALTFKVKVLDAAQNSVESTYTYAGQPFVAVQGRAVLSTAGWQSTWPGVQWATSFTGTAIGVQFNDAQNYYQIELDGVISQVTPASGERTIWLENLSNSQHSIKVLRKNESAFSASGLFKGFVLKNSADRWLPASVNSKSIEFIGDSYTVAMGNTSTSRTCTDAQISATTDASQGFAKLTAQALGADVQINAMSGMGIIRNWDGNGAPNNFRSYYPYTLQTDLGQSYNNPNWQPQVVVIGLGINDFSTEVHAGEAWTTESLASEYVSQYKSFLAGIKSKYNNPQIILTATYLWPNDRMRPLVQQVVNDEKAAGNSKISYMDLGTLELTGCQWHPSLNDHKNIKDKLLNLINSLNVW